MSKPAQFLWHWEDYAPLPDKLMTRARAAHLLRAWRRAKTQGQREYSVRRICHPARREYLCTHIPSGERGGFSVVTRPSLAA